MTILVDSKIGNQKVMKLNETCVSGKKSFADRKLAEESLIQHHILNEFRDNQGPINVYHCDECGNWHFTSKGIKNSLFDDYEVADRIKRERLASYWERRIK